MTQRIWIVCCFNQCFRQFESGIHITRIYVQSCVEEIDFLRKSRGGKSLLIILFSLTIDLLWIETNERWTTNYQARTKSCQGKAQKTYFDICGRNSHDTNPWVTDASHRASYALLALQYSTPSNSRNAWAFSFRSEYNEPFRCSFKHPWNYLCEMSQPGRNINGRAGDPASLRFRGLFVSDWGLGCYIIKVRNLFIKCNR